MSEKRRPSPLLEYALRTDVRLTNRCVHVLLRQQHFATLKTHGRMLEWSCNGIVWLAGTLVFTWLFNRESLHQMQFNLLLGLLLDIVVVAVLKSICRRRRPGPPGSMALGPDKFSFPSGHASRSVFVVCFFISLVAVPYLLWPPLLAWCVCVCLSRVLTHRHYILDVLGGVTVGVLETLLLSLLWAGQSTSSDFIRYISDFSADDSE